MKKLIGILMAVMMLAAFACAASADEVPQPEAGKKFESDWAIPGGFAQIVYEEEGYRVMLEKDEADGTGSLWQYSCYYHEDTDTLLSSIVMVVFSFFRIFLFTLCEFPVINECFDQAHDHEENDVESAEQRLVQRLFIDQQFKQ